MKFLKLLYLILRVNKNDQSFDKKLTKNTRNADKLRVKKNYWNVSSHFFRFLFFVFVITNALTAFAGPARTTYQARIIKPDGYPLEASNVSFKFTILDPIGSCILYSETYSSVNMSSTGGMISFALGSGVKTYPASATTFEQVFSNITPSLSCDAGGPTSVSPGPNDIRKIVMQFHDGSGWQTLPAMSINAVPYAMYANEASRLNGKTDSDFVQVSTLPMSCGVSEALRFNGTSFSCLAVGGGVTSGSVITALGYTPADGASLTTITSNLSNVSTYASNVSSTVFSVSSTVSSLSNSVTSLENTVAASFAAITSSQWVTSGTTIFYNSGNVHVSGGVRISMDAGSCAANSAGTLRYNAGVVEYCNGTSWSAFGVAGAGITLINGSASGTQTYANGTGGTAPAFNTTNGVHTLNIPLASAGSVTAGLLSNADYSTFMNKITSSAVSIAQVLGYVPASSTALSNYLAKANNLSDLASATVARTNLQLGSLAELNFVDLGSSYVSGTLAIARLPNFVGDATVAAASNTIILSNSGVAAGTYTKVTVDAKGRVTSSSSLASSDVTTALGYTPASASAATQWNTSGTTINYTTGNVGVGTVAPTQKLHVAGKILIDEGPTTSIGTGGGSGIEFKNTAVNATLFRVDSNASSSSANFVAMMNTNSGFGPVVFSEGADGVIPLRIWGKGQGSVLLQENGGNVGVGTTSPSYTLDVSGTSRVSKFLVGDGAFNAPSIAFANSPGTGFYNAGGYIGFSVASGLRAQMSSSSLSFNAGGAGPQLYFTGGNAANPSYAFNVDSDTGMFNPNSSGGSNELGFSTSGTEKVRISSTGNVGIGTTTPSAKLHLSAGTSTTGTLKFTSGTLLASPQSGTMEYDGSQFYLTDGANTRRAIATGSSAGSIDNAQTINSTGNITMVPVGSVVVSATTASTNSQTGALIVKGGLGVAGSINTAGNLNVSGSSVIDGALKLSSMTSGSVLFAGAGGTIAQDNASFFWDDTNNRLGLGTTAPTTRLEVVGTVSGSYMTSQNYSIQGGNGNMVILKSYQDAGGNGSVYIGNSAGGGTANGHNTFFNTVVGHGSYSNNTAGTGNSIFGKSAAGGSSGSYNTIMGTFAAQNGIGDENVLLGAYAGQGSAGTNIYGNVLIGKQAGQNITTGAYNTIIGYRAASATVGTGSNNILIGYNVGMAVSSTSNFINIGNTIYGSISTGNVGIGTTTPGAKLTVQDGSLGFLLGADNGASTLTNATAKLARVNMPHYTNAEESIHLIGGLSTNTDTIAYIGGGSTNYNAATRLQFYTAASTTTLLGTERMRIDANGNVGIGTLAPVARLDLGVASAGVTTGIFARGADNNFRMESIAGDATNANGDLIGKFGMRYLTTGTDTAMLRFYRGTTSYDGTLAIATSGTDRVTINGLGNVGIGTATPDRNTSIVESTGGTGRGLTVRTYNSTNTGGVIEVAGGLGTPAAPVALTSGMSLGFYTLAGYDGTSVMMQSTPNGMFSNATENWSSTAHGANLKFATTPNGSVSGIERMRIDQNGYVGIGTPSPGANLQVSSNNATGYTIISNTNIAAGGLDWRWYSSATGAPLGANSMCFGTGVCLFSLFSSGNATLGGTLTQSSDGRLKRDISSIPYALAAISKLDGVTYYWKDSRKSPEKQIGLIAQEVEKVFPEAVATDASGYKSVAYQNLIAPVINAIREVREWMFKTDERVQALEEENKALKAYLCSKDPQAPICNK